AGIGAWTIEKLALHGQGRMDQIPAGDLAFLKLVGRIRSGGDPWARATEDEVREFFEPYAPWAGLAGAHALHLGAQAAVAKAPGRRGTRSSTRPAPGRAA
ncbi:MAG TPA: hypothetical protein VHE14_02815, partial [Solirubrobacteraceae bacterium]|nr:hypothetical protein [Solirubrobacteraceae bacterium]